MLALYSQHGTSLKKWPNKFFRLINYKIWKKLIIFGDGPCAEVVSKIVDEYKILKYFALQSIKNL